MPHHLDLETWPRREAFDFFRGFDKPYINICTRLDVTGLKAAQAQAGVGSLFLAYHHIALSLANQIEPFRYRLEAGRARVCDAVRGGTTVLRDDDSLGFATLEPAADYAVFARRAAAAIAAARSPQAGFEPRPDDADVVHFTTLPWVHFSSLSHARNWHREDSVPKISFGRIDADGSRLWLPLSVEVHHALMDGVHVGRYVQGFEAALREPQDWLGVRV